MKIKQEIPMLAYQLQIDNVSEDEHIAIIRYWDVDENFFIERKSDNSYILLTTSKKTYDGLFDYLKQYQDQSEENYTAVMRKFPDENNPYYAITANISRETKEKVLRMYWNRIGFVYYDWSKIVEDAGDLSMSLTDPNLVYDLTTTLKKCGVDVSHIEEEMPKYLKECIDNKWNGGSN